MNDYWTPDRRWEGQDVFIIGGGPSLKDFDWTRLAGKHTLGCNEAFRIDGFSIEALFFSDARWFVRVCRELENFNGLIVTHEDPLRYHNLVWLKVLKRYAQGLHRDGLGFGNNSGSGAINLALLLGAKRVFLLGFDCKVSKVHGNNWHDHYEGHNPKHFVPPFYKFIHGMKAVAKDLPVVYPGCEVINLNPDSALDVFPKVDPETIIPVPCGYVP